MAVTLAKRVGARRIFFGLAGYTCVEALNVYHHAPASRIVWVLLGTIGCNLLMFYRVVFVSPVTLTDAQQRARRFRFGVLGCANAAVALSILHRLFLIMSGIHHTLEGLATLLWACVTFLYAPCLIHMTRMHTVTPSPLAPPITPQPAQSRRIWLLWIALVMAIWGFRKIHTLLQITHIMEADLLAVGFVIAQCARWGWKKFRRVW